MESMDVAIIGAGMAGVSAGLVLRERGHRVRLYEKSRGYGGRCASKRWEGHVIDHGAQYFTMRDARFRGAVEAACGWGLLELKGAVVDEQGIEIAGGPRWYHREGNSRLVRALAEAGALDVVMGREVGSARELLREGGGAYDLVVCTAPPEQTARLCGVGGGWGQVSAPCLAVLLAYEGEWAGKSGEVYGVSERGGPLAWSACENHKEGRVACGQTVIVAHLSEEFSRQHLERSPEEWVALVRPMVEGRWGLGGVRLAAALGHRWRYARASLGALGEPAMGRGVGYVGDALEGGRVEGAWLAGLRVADWEGV